MIAKLAIRIAVTAYLAFQAGRDARTGRVPVWTGDLAVALSLAVFALTGPSAGGAIEALVVALVLGVLSLPVLGKRRVMGSGDAKAYVAIYLSSSAAFSVESLVVLAFVGLMSCASFVFSTVTRRVASVEGRAPFFPSLLCGYASVCLASLLVMHIH